MMFKNLNIYFFFLVLILVSVGAFMLFSPYLSAIFVAALFSVMFYKVYLFFEKIFHNKKMISSTITCVLIALIIVLPLVGVGKMVANEVSNVVNYFTENDSNNQQTVSVLIESFKQSAVGETLFSHVSENDIKESLTQLAKKISGAVGPIVKKTYNSIVNGTIWIFVMFFSLFYFFIDGPKFVNKVKYLSPLRDKHEDMLIEKFVSMARATLKGTFIIGSVQGILGGIAFLIAGVSSPMLWTVVMIFLSIIPALGASLIIIPGGIIMFALGYVWQGIFLIVVGAGVSSVDNILRPKLVGEDTKMHSLLIFFSTIGGMSVYGIIGFIIGPIIMSLAVAMWEIFAVEFKDDIERFNA